MTTANNEALRRQRILFGGQDTPDLSLDPVSFDIPTTTVSGASEVAVVDRDLVRAQQVSLAAAAAIADTANVFK